MTLQSFTLRRRKLTQSRRVGEAVTDCQTQVADHDLGHGSVWWSAATRTVPRVQLNRPRRSRGRLHRQPRTGKLRRVVPFILAGFATLMVIGLTTYDAALEYLHDKFYSTWLSAGKPRGVLWKASGTEPEDPYAHLWIGVKLVYRDPSWAFTDDHLRRRTRIARVLIIVGAVGLAVTASQHL